MKIFVDSSLYTGLGLYFDTNRRGTYTLLCFNSYWCQRNESPFTVNRL